MKSCKAQNDNPHPPKFEMGLFKVPPIITLLAFACLAIAHHFKPTTIKDTDQVPTSSLVPSIGLLQWHCNLFKLFTVLTLFKHLWWQNHAGVTRMVLH